MLILPSKAKLNIRKSFEQIFYLITILISSLMVRASNAHLGQLRYSSMLILTRTEVQLQPIVGFRSTADDHHERHYQILKVPCTLPSLFADFDFEHATNRLVIIARDTDKIKLPRLYIMDFSRPVSATDWHYNSAEFIEFVDISHSKQLLDRVRFNYTTRLVPRALRHPAHLLLWSRQSPASMRACKFDLTPSGSESTVDEILVCRRIARFGEDWRDNIEIDPSGDWRLSDIVADVSRQALFAIFSDVGIENNKTSSPILAQQHGDHLDVNYSELLHLVKNQSTSVAFRLGYDSVKKETWVLFVELEPQPNIFLHCIDPPLMMEQSLVVKANLGEGIHPMRAIRLSVHKRIACLTVMISTGRAVVIAVRIGHDLEDAHVVNVQLIEGLLGAICVTDKSASTLAKFAAPIADDPLNNPALLEHDIAASSLLTYQKHVIVLLLVISSITKHRHR